MRHLTMTMAVLAFVALSTPTPTQAQVGTCWICDYEEINPCTGSSHGATECAQPDPEHCDLYGDACEPTFAALDIAPQGTGWVSSEYRELAALAATDGSRATVLRDCRDVILVARMSADDAERLRGETDRIIL